MKLTSKTLAAVRACIELGKKKELTGLDSLVNSLGLSRAFLNKIMYELGESNIVSSKKGPNGGYALVSGDITLLKVAEALGEKQCSDTITGKMLTDETINNTGLNLNITVNDIINSEKNVYLDYAATTPLDRRVLEKMMPYLTVTYGNANSVHQAGRDAAYGIDGARRTIAGIIGCEKKEVYFTGGGSEGNNWVIDRASRAIREKTGRSTVLISALEHPSVYEAAMRLKNDGFKVVEIPVFQNGQIDLPAYENLIGEDTALISIMTANNEIGSVQNIKGLVLLAHEKGAYFHTDAVQALGCMDINVHDTRADYMTFSSHKFYGPKGVGGVYIRSGSPITPLITGGHQERSRRGGTSNTAGIVGMSEALKLTRINMEEENERVRRLRDYLEGRILETFSFAFINGRGGPRVCSNLNVTFRGCRADALLDLLDIKGVAASAGAACSSGSIEPSRVLTAIGLSPEDAGSSIRFSLGRYTTKEDADFTLAALEDCLK